MYFYLMNIYFFAFQSKAPAPATTLTSTAAMTTPSADKEEVSFIL